jgi:hypothetical protein
MHRRLTFDAYPEELACRDSGTSEVSFLWSRRTRRAAVVVEDDVTGEATELEMREGDDPLDVHEHAFAHAPRRGRPGRVADRP